MRVALETFLNEINEKTEINNQYPVLTSSKAGLYLQSDYFNKQVASKDNVGYKVIRRGQFTYRAMSDTGEFFPNMLECTDIGIVSPAYPVFEIFDKSIIVPEYLKYFFKSDSFQHSIAGFAQGSTRTSVKFGKMKTVKINLPSIYEQKEIISVLDKSKALVQSREQELQKLDELVKARFVEMFDRYEATSTIGELTSICRGASPRPISSFITNDEDGENWIKIGDVGENDIYITHTSEKVTKSGADKSRRVKPGDFILSNSMSFGRPYILAINGCVHDGWLIISDYEDKFEQLFFYYLLRSERVQCQFNGSVAGAVVKNLNSELVRKVKVITPPLDEQKKFVDFANQVDKSKAAVQKALDEAQLLFDSLMQKYFG